MPATQSGNKGRSSTILSFTPRQVLLTNPIMKNAAVNGNLKLKNEQKLLLHQSIANYLEHSGFSKSLKKFRSEAQIEKDGLEGSPIDLEEMYFRYLDICRKDDKSTIYDGKAQVADVESKSKEGKVKEKKKKTKELVSESSANNMKDNQFESPTLVTEINVKDDLSADAKGDKDGNTEKGSKHKMKKKNKSNSEGDAIELIGDSVVTVSKKENSKASTRGATHGENKNSKKRKRQISEENGEQVAEIKGDEETKCRKKENDSIKENIVASGDQFQKTPTLKSNGKTNGHLDNGSEKSTVKKSKNKHSDSVEAKPAKAAFQRVLVDKVEFVDERLQDNSYWAKDGAEVGYGAKAEEILGQVRGRDFRHEKTKKKRGTYRGGQIDLDSHSVKFNYSDED